MSTSSADRTPDVITPNLSMPDLSMTDLIIPAGPNCRNTINTRTYFGLQRAYPFDWWFTPISSLLAMLRPDFKFEVSADDIVLMDTDTAENTGYNKRYRILHHHDFPRVEGMILPPTDAQMSNLNSKYQALFRRMHDDIARATAVIFVAEGLQYGFKLIDQGAVPPGPRPDLKQIGSTIRDYFGEKAGILSLSAGETATRIEPGAVCLSRPDDGTRRYDQRHPLVFAEPVNVHTRLFDELGLSAARRNMKHIADAGDDFTPPSAPG
jgi:hypothetical protein